MTKNAFSLAGIPRNDEPTGWYHLSPRYDAAMRLHEDPEYRSDLAFEEDEEKVAPE